MQERKENELLEERTKELIEHAYRAGIGTLSAFRSMLPAPPTNSRALREFRNAQKEMLLTARSFIDAQIAFIDRFDASSGNSGGKKPIKKVEIKERKQSLQK
jgi:hypothetical protein